MAHDVFISHAHKDKDIADAICEKLESEQVSCWMAARDISAIEDRTEATRNAIGSSRVMVLVLSENANAAPHIEREIAHAFYTRRAIVPIRMANTLPRRDFLFYLGSVRWFNAFSPSTTHHLAALTAHIKSLVPDRAAAFDGAPCRAVTATMTGSNLSNAWPDALRVPRYWTLGILKWVTIAACLFLLWLLWFAPQQAKEGLPVADNSAGLMSPDRAMSPGSSPQVNPETSVSKPRSTFTRFGLWEAPNTGPTPLAQPAPQAAPPVTEAASSPRPQVAPPDIVAVSSPTPQVESPIALAASTPVPHAGQSATHKTKKVATQQGTTNTSAPVGPPPKISRQTAKLASSRKSGGPSIRRIVPPGPASDDQEYREPDSSISWHNWLELPAYEVKIRTGERYLGSEKWGHYLGFELSPTSQKVVKISSIHLQGETALDRELSPTTRDAIVTIVNHHRTAEKGLWGWTLLAEPQDTGSPALAEQRLQDASGGPPTAQPVPLQPFLQPEIDKTESVTWHGWQQVAGYDVAIRTGDHYLGGGSWAHYLGFQLAPTSQQVIKVSLIRLEGETAAGTELSPTARQAVVKIVNHHMIEERGAWGWALQEIQE
jgi:TIR domain